MFFELLSLIIIVGTDTSKIESNCGGVIVTKINADFETAQIHCKSLGLNIVRIESKEQNRCVTSMAWQKEIPAFWTDGSDIKTEGIWQNSDNNNLKYTNWANGQPDSYSHTQDCIGVSSHSSTLLSYWYDDECSSKYGIICACNKIEGCKVSSAPGSVIINKVENGSSLEKTVSWTYFGNNDSSIYYRVEYGLKYESSSDFVETSDKHIVIKGLEKNMIYKIRVRAQTLAKVENNLQYGPFSGIVYFYTGIEKPTIEYYNEDIHFSNTQVNITWTLDKSSGEAVFEYIIRMVDSSKSCLISVNLVCSSCHSQYNKINLKESENFYRKSLKKCQKNNENTFEQSANHLSVVLEKNDLNRANLIEIYAINLIGVHKVWRKYICRKGEAQTFHFMEIQSIFNNFDKKIDFNKYSLSGNSSHVKTLKDYNETGNAYIVCNYGELVHLFVEIQIENKLFKIPFNFSCANQAPPNIIKNLTYKEENNFSHIFWNTTMKGSHDYIICWMNNENYFYKFLKSEKASYSLDSVWKNNWKQICIATIDNQWRTSKYTCSQYSVHPAPVVNLKAYSMNSMIYVSWDKLKEDIHHGYVVNVTSSNGLCQTTTINMKYYTVNVKRHCRNKDEIRWLFLKPLMIRNIIPGNAYRISVSSLKGNYSSLPTVLKLKTNVKETIRNLQITSNSSHLSIRFEAPRGTKTFTMNYHVKVTLHGRNMCTFKYKVIFDEVISETSKFITTPLLRMCFQYEVEVTPLRQYNIHQNPVRLHLLRIDYYPSIKKGFLYNITEKSTTLKNLQAILLSMNLLKLTWSDNLPQDDCNHFGFMVELFSLADHSDCKTWIIARTTCTTLLNDIEKEATCKNKEYLIFQNKWINETLLLNGQFNVENTYWVKVWDIKDKITKIMTGEVKYDDKSECLQDCYGPRYTGIEPTKMNNQTCQVWKKRYHSKTFSKYNSNICYIDKYSNIIPLCFNEDNSHSVSCTQKCTKPSKGELCDKTVKLYPSKKSITVNLPLFGSSSDVKGYIILLHDTEHKCQQYSLKTCTNCIDLSKMKSEFRRFYKTCNKSNFNPNFYNETTFDGLLNNREYNFYIIPLLSSVAFGKILTLRTATLISDTVTPSYIKILNINKNSLQFSWNSYKKRSASSYFDHYMCTLMNMKSNKKISKNHTKEISTFIKLDSCTKYCFYLNVVDESDQVKLVDYVCTYTLSSSLGVITLDDVESGPSLSRLISWTHNGGDECLKNYHVELHNLYLNEIINITTNGTTLFVDDLKKDMTYRVRVRMESYIHLENSTNVSQYSKGKEFFTGQVNFTISNARSYFDSSRKILDVLWTLKNPASASVQSFMIRVNNTVDICLASITFDFQPHMGLRRQALASQHFVERWDKLSKCIDSSKMYFTIHSKIFAGTITSSQVLDNYTLSIYGLNVLGIHKLYEKILG